MFRRMILGVVAIAAVMGAAGSAAAQVSVNIGINVPAPPHLVVVPATPVMYAPAVEANYFFYGGKYYVFHEGAWFFGSAHRGPWTFLAVEHVPPPLRRVPPGYYKIPPGHRKDKGPPPWAGEGQGHKHHKHDD